MRFTLLILALLAACRPQPASTGAAPRETADAVIRALSTHDMRGLSELVDSASGVRFSPYPHVDTTADRTFTREQIGRLWSASAPLVWGTRDGSGEPIRLRYPEYHQSFVYDFDFLRAPNVAVDSLPMGRGNAINNIAAAYPGATIVEYHSPGTDPKYDGMDWRSLWVVLRQRQSRWYVVGIVHGAWTI